MRRLSLALTAALLVVGPAVVHAQSGEAPNRAGSWEFGLAGGAQLLDAALRDLLVKGPTAARFSNGPTLGRLVPMGELRVGYNLNHQFGVSVSAGSAMSNGVTLLTLGPALTWTLNQDGGFAPFASVGTEYNHVTGTGTRTAWSVWGANLGLGARQMLSDQIALRLEGRLRAVSMPDVPVSRGITYSPLLLAGLTFYTPGRARIAPCASCALPRVTRAAASDTVRIVRVDTLRVTRVDTVRFAVAAPVVPVAPPPIIADQVLLRVQFRTDRAELLPASRPILVTVAAAIKATPGSYWQVEGHTDSIGLSSRNRELSQARAESVVDFLVRQGVNPLVLTAVGYGPDRPVFANTTEAGRAANRRVQLHRVLPPSNLRTP
jgi:outer membrane protein OmpA-like peptidoglycan-associated protein